MRDAGIGEDDPVDSASKKQVAGDDGRLRPGVVAPLGEQRNRSGPRGNSLQPTLGMSHQPGDDFRGDRRSGGNPEDRRGPFRPVDGGLVQREPQNVQASHDDHPLGSARDDRLVGPQGPSACGRWRRRPPPARSRRGAAGPDCSGCREPGPPVCAGWPGKGPAQPSGGPLLPPDLRPAGGPSTWSKASRPGRDREKGPEAGGPAGA